MLELAILVIREIPTAFNRELCVVTNRHITSKPRSGVLNLCLRHQKRSVELTGVQKNTMVHDVIRDDVLNKESTVPWKMETEQQPVSTEEQHWPNVWVVILFCFRDGWLPNVKNSHHDEAKRKYSCRS